MKTLALSLLCAIGLSVGATAAQASEFNSDLARLDGSIARKVDPYLDGARGVTEKRDVYTEGARSVTEKRDVYTEGARGVTEKRDVYSEGA
ncbi:MULTISPECIES: hypothetical protein [Cupriavidus]|jgi:hypothetical protein|uniref:Uncharacterized protein n=1 Tax=Cupriavidus metallidurans TaxID=119219 RepID=A0A482IXB4_9BURK|nr:MULTISPECIES: hypothetical protein [Cupriavidus]KWR82469.1 hypothetical protein RN01_13425 [Cupriavidus sp. SHE]QBP13628.1 hypothetical protein DDF84_028985 [Cupriavidus metallidurans]QWC91406.1 hypothetical protein KB891_28420 [Cupriavidus metallidurans]